MFKIKTTLICFFDISGIIHFEFVPEGAAANQTFYVEVLKGLADAVRHKRGESWRDRSLFLHHKAPASSSLRVPQFVASLPRIIRCTDLTWLRPTSGCFQNSRVC
jgi:hypothetical protein